jgi:hypothetical protein
MSHWTPEELTRIANAEELAVTATGTDGATRKPVTVWVVRDGDALYVRSYKGKDGAWYRNVSKRSGRVRAAGIERDVEFAHADDTTLNDRIDEAYRAKYARHGSAFVDPMVADQARATTLRLNPRQASA